MCSHQTSFLLGMEGCKAPPVGRGAQCILEFCAIALSMSRKVGISRRAHGEAVVLVKVHGAFKLYTSF